VGEVASVFYMGNMITVEKADEADWDDLLPRLGRAHPRGGGDILGRPRRGGGGCGRGVGGPLAAVLSGDPRLVRINEILDERIRPRSPRTAAGSKSSVSRRIRSTYAIRARAAVAPVL
jgi:hypothetical protein